MGALPIPLGPLGGIPSLAGKFLKTFSCTILNKNKNFKTLENIQKSLLNTTQI
jgi:hypothetical protein